MSSIRKFETGATRDQDTTKPDYEGFLSPLVIERYGQYMSKHRVQANGELRDSDNWQKGIPKNAYIKSGWRHFMDWWKEHRGHSTPDGLEDALCALLFNISGYLHEVLRAKKAAQILTATTVEAGYGGPGEPYLPVVEKGETLGDRTSELVWAGVSGQDDGKREAVSSGATHSGQSYSNTGVVYLGRTREPKTTIRGDRPRTVHSAAYLGCECEGCQAARVQEEWGG